MLAITPVSFRPGKVRIYPIAGSASLVVGQPVLLDSTGHLNVCAVAQGTDDAVIGFAAAAYTSTGGTDHTLVPVWEAFPDDVFEGSCLSDTAPSLTAGTATAFTTVQALVGVSTGFTDNSALIWGLGVTSAGAGGSVNVTKWRAKILDLSPKDALGTSGGRVLFCVRADRGPAGAV